MKLAYCEDETVQEVYLEEILKQWEKQSGEICELTLYQSAEQMLFENTESMPFDFILLDIELGKMNGIELARKIRTIDQEVTIAFLSNYKQYVFEGYEVNAVRYLLKPITIEQIAPVLDAILLRKSKEKKSILVMKEGELIKVYQREIQYIEAVGHYIKMITANGNFEVKKSLTKISQELSEESILSTHRSYLVNLRYVVRVTKTECILEQGEHIPVSRTLYRQVNEAFIQYYKGEGNI